MSYVCIYNKNLSLLKFFPRFFRTLTLAALHKLFKCGDILDVVKKKKKQKTREEAKPRDISTDMSENQNRVNSSTLCAVRKSSTAAYGTSVVETMIAGPTNIAWLPQHGFENSGAICQSGTLETTTATKERKERCSRRQVNLLKPFISRSLRNQEQLTHL